MKINLVLSKSNWTSFHQIAFTHIIQDYFNIVFVEDTIPNKDNSLLVANPSNIDWYQELVQQGYPLVIDLMWGERDPAIDNSFKLTAKNWFWYHEALLYFRKGYDQYTPNRKYVKKALMPMGLRKESHDLLFDQVTNYLDDFVYSYIERLGRYLPNDAPTNFYGSTMQNQRYFNPEWYNDTYFSLVSETRINNQFELHITEKTFKPIAFYHPFLIWGQPRVLEHLTSLGFETYGNLFDESYDLEFDSIKRLNKILDNIKSFEYVEFDSITDQKAKHNHQLFFSVDIIKDRVKKEIVDPIIEFFEKS
jgi:hypothetical protein